MSLKISRLGDFVKIKTGKLDANASSKDGIYPFFTCSKEPLKISSYTYDCECVLVAGNGDLNVKYYEGKFDAYQRTYIVEALNNETLNVRYLYYFLDTYLEKLREQSIGGVIKYIKLENLSDAKIPLPPLPIQKRIAEILDAADALKRKDQELLKKYDELAQAIFIDMFGDPVKNEKGWECLTGEDYANRISVGVVIKPASYYVKEGAPALRSQNIRPNRITKDNLVYFSEETNDKVLFKSKVFTGDVLIVRTGQPGTAAVVEADINGINCIDMLIVTPKKEIISPYYLAFFLNSDAGKNYISSNQKGQIQQHFNVGDINKFKIPIPPIGLQLLSSGELSID